MVTRGRYGAESEQPITDWQLTASTFCVLVTWSLDPNDLHVITSQRNQGKRPGVLLCRHQAWEGLVSSAHSSPLWSIRVRQASTVLTTRSCSLPVYSWEWVLLCQYFSSYEKQWLHLVNSNGQTQSVPGLTSDPFFLRCSGTWFLRHQMGLIFPLFPGCWLLSLFYGLIFPFSKY